MAIAKQNNDLRISNAFKMSRRLAIELKSKYDILDFVIHFILKKKMNFHVFGENVSVLSCFVFIHI